MVITASIPDELKAKTSHKKLFQNFWHRMVIVTSKEGLRYMCMSKQDW